MDHDHLSHPPPPSYEELYMEGQSRGPLQELVREFDVDNVPVQEICKFIVAMTIIALTVALVGTAFHFWGS